MMKTMMSVTSFKMTAGRWSRCLFMSSPPTTSSITPTQTWMEQQSHCEDPMRVASAASQLKNFDIDALSSFSESEGVSNRKILSETH
jgi:hypothetical protein